MKCMSLIASSARATHCAASCVDDAFDNEEDNDHCSMPSRLMGPPLIMEAAAKVDKCLARLQSLQGTVTIPTPPVSASVSACLSPSFGKSRSCLHGSPRVLEDDKIRIHDVLRFSDDFSRKMKRERREQYMRRLSRSKTEVFDDKKDPLDPHGEWKHWSSPAGDVHKVISEILMASQIAKQITSMVNAALVQTDCSSDDSGQKSLMQKATKAMAASPSGRPNSSHRPPTKETATSSSARPTPGDRHLKETATSSTQSNKCADKRGDPPHNYQVVVATEAPANKRADPLHKFRVVVATDGPAKKRTNAGSRKEVLYPKSKPGPDHARPAFDSAALSSTAKKMQSRRSPRAGEATGAPDSWIAKEITNRKARLSQDSKKAAPAKAKLPSSGRIVRRSGSPPRPIVEKPKMGSSASATTGSKPSTVVIKQRNPPQLKPSAERATSPPTATTPSATTTKSNRQTLPGAASVVPPATESQALPEEALAPGPPISSSLSDSQAFNLASGLVSGGPEMGESNPVTSAVGELRKCSASSSPLRQGGTHASPLRQGDSPAARLQQQPLMGSLRHKFVMEATEIKRNKPWRLAQHKSSKAVLFSNPAFAPASPRGARPARPALEKTAVSPPPSPPRSESATRRVMNRIGRAINSGRRSISPDIARRLNSTRRKLCSLSPAKSLPSLISRLPSRGKKTQAQTSAPRPGSPQHPPCTRTAPISGDLPLPPGRKAQQQNLAAAPNHVRIIDHTSIAEQLNKDFGPRPASTTGDYTVRQLKDLDCNRQTNPRSADVAPNRKENHVKSFSASDWENEVGVIGVLSACRKWVENSAPPLPGAAGIYGHESPESVWDTRPQKENVVPIGRSGEVGVIGCKFSCKGMIEDLVMPGPARSANPGLLKRSWSADSRSFSTGKIRAGSALLRRARDWVRTQTPYRDRLQQSVA